MKKKIALLITGLFAIVSAQALRTNMTAGVIYSDGTNVMSFLNGNIISTNTSTKIQGYEVQGVAVVEAGVGGVSAGMLSIADRSAGFGWQNLFFTNGVLVQVSTTETNIISKQICELSFVEAASQEFTGGGGYQIVTNFVTSYTDGACITPSSTGLVAAASGWYSIDHAISLESTSGASVLECDLYVNESDASDMAGQEIHWKHQFTVTAATAYKGFNRMLYLTAGDFVSLRIDPQATTESVQWFSGQLRMTLIRQ